MRETCKRDAWENIFTRNYFIHSLCVSVSLSNGVVYHRYPYGPVKLLMNALIILLYVCMYKSALKRDGMLSIDCWQCNANHSRQSECTCAHTIFSSWEKDLLDAWSVDGKFFFLIFFVRCRLLVRFHFQTVYY